MFCYQCGARLQEKQAFCASCGTRVAPMNSRLFPPLWALIVAMVCNPPAGIIAYLCKQRCNGGGETEAAMLHIVSLVGTIGAYALGAVSVFIFIIL